MSTDTFEDQLRSLLHDTADAEGPAYVDVDPHAVVTSGRRVIRRRRLATGAGIAAAVVAFGAGAWAVLDQSSRQSLEPVPATRSASVAPDVVSTTLAVDGSSRVASYTVNLDRSTGRVTATDTSATGEKGLDVVIGRIGEREQKAVWETLSRDPLVVVGVVPAEADELMTRFGYLDVGGVTSADVGGVTSTQSPLTRTAYEAFLVQTEKSPPGVDLAGLDWSASGRVFDVEGHELPSATIGDRTVYLNDVGGELGMVAPDGTSRVWLQGTTTPHLSTWVKEQGGPTVTSFAIVLPIDAGDISLEVAPGATLVSQQSAPLSGGAGVAVVATVKAPGSVDRVVRQVTWTADGRQSTWRDAG